MRLFVAIEMPDEVRRHLEGIQKRLRQRLDLRWTKSEQMHLTLKFIGERKDAELPGLIEAIQSVRVKQEIQLRCNGLETFPHVLAATMADEAGRCAELQSRIDGILPPSEHRQWKPHVTLARSHRPIRGVDIGAELARQGESAIGPPFHVEDFVLFQSILSDRSPRYVPLARFPLNK